MISTDFYWFLDLDVYIDFYVSLYMFSLFLDLLWYVSTNPSIHMHARIQTKSEIHIDLHTTSAMIRHQLVTAVSCQAAKCADSTVSRSGGDHYHGLWRLQHTTSFTHSLYSLIHYSTDAKHQGLWVYYCNLLLASFFSFNPGIKTGTKNIKTSQRSKGGCEEVASMNQEMSTPARHPKAQTGRWQILCGTHLPPGPRSMAFWQTMALAMFGYIMLYGVFLKWGYPKMDGLKWEILYQNEWFGGTSILGNLHRYMSGALLAEEMLFFSQQLLSVWLYAHMARFRHCHDQRFQDLGDNVSKARYKMPRGHLRLWQFAWLMNT